MSILKNSAVHVAVAFVAMGSWAVYVNRAYPMPAPLVAGLSQGMASAVITLFLKRMIEFTGKALNGLASLVVPPAAAALCSLIILLTIHTLSHTPDILATIALPLSVTTVYACAYNFLNWRRSDGRRT
ncbi:hypothetical protein [Martelella mangrovi]|uniref:Heme exporter protein D n=1 Tax=Martelella mangrovi TaxID=1397477 RepID=A0ABV2IGL9_9HYPH